MSFTGSAEHLRYNKLLSEVTYQRGFGEMGIGARLMPLVRSTKLSGNYLKVDRQRVEPYVNIKRAPGAQVKKAERDNRSYISFQAEDYRILKDIPIEISDGMSDSELLEEKRSKAIEVVNMVEFAHEKSVHESLWRDSGNQAAQTTAYQTLYGADRVILPASTAGFSGAKWDVTTSNVRFDVLKGRDIVYRTCGYDPNTLVITSDAFNKIVTSDNDFKKAWLNTAPGASSMNNLQNLAAHLGVSQVIVPRVLKDGAGGISEAKAEVEKDFMWQGATAGLFYINPARSRNMITLGSTYYWDSPEVRWLGVYEGFNRGTKSHEVESGGYFTTKVVDLGCGLIFTDILT